MNKNIILIDFFNAESLPLRYLHSSLKDSSFNPICLFIGKRDLYNSPEEPSENDLDLIINFIKQKKPIFVGLSVRSAYFQFAKRLTEKIKMNIKVKVLWGGTHTTLKPTQSLLYADNICRGDGEISIVNYANNLLNGKPNKKILSHTFIEDLDKIECPDFTNENKFILEKHTIKKYKHKIESYYILTSRGCPFNCTYCCNHQLKKIDTSIKYCRRRSVSNVMKELRLAKRLHQPTKISFCDDVFTSDIKWLKEFSKLYIEEIGLPFNCYTHPNCIDEEKIIILKKMGVRNMDMGIQSGSEEFLYKTYKRYTRNSSVIKFAKLAKKYNIETEYDIILDNPLESDEDRRKTFNLLLQLPRPFVLYTMMLTHFPETELTNKLLEEGKITQEEVEDSKHLGLTKWSVKLDYSRGKNSLFWDNLYYMISDTKINKKIIMFLSNNYLIKKYPKILTFILRFFSTSIFTLHNRSVFNKLKFYILFCIQKPKVVFNYALRVMNIKQHT